MSTINVTAKYSNESMNKALLLHLKNNLGKSITFEAGLKTKNIFIEQNCDLQSTSKNELDTIIYTTSPSSNITIGFIILNERSLLNDLPKVLEAMNYCHKLYLVTDLKRRDSLYDLLNMNDLEELGVIGRMSDSQFVLCKIATSQRGIDNNTLIEEISEKQYLFEIKKIEAIQ